MQIHVISDSEGEIMIKGWKKKMGKEENKGEVSTAEMQGKKTGKGEGPKATLQRLNSDLSKKVF